MSNLNAVALAQIELPRLFGLRYIYMLQVFKHSLFKEVAHGSFVYVGYIII